MFKFKFTVLLKQRKRAEEAAQREYMLAQNELADCLSGIQRMYDSVEFSRNEISRLEKNLESHPLGQVLENEKFIEGQKIRIEKERQRARDLMRVAEMKHEVLIEAAKEFKKIDRLREKNQERYNKEQKKLENKRVDDLVTIRSGRRGIV